MYLFYIKKYCQLNCTWSFISMNYFDKHKIKVDCQFVIYSFDYKHDNILNTHMNYVNVCANIPIYYIDQHRIYYFFNLHLTIKCENNPPKFMPL